MKERTKSLISAIVDGHMKSIEKLSEEKVNSVKEQLRNILESALIEKDAIRSLASRNNIIFCKKFDLIKYESSGFNISVDSSKYANPQNVNIPRITKDGMWTNPYIIPLNIETEDIEMVIIIKSKEKPKKITSG